VWKVKSVEKSQNYRNGHQITTEKQETYKLTEGVNKEKERKPDPIKDFIPRSLIYYKI
jgi:hypothetical protein